ncbi:redox-sensitive bicupin YhaK (pirin superfamily) [Variovorax boronicumulans]|uniref:Redox-sensitive bicupin YhaK (Pirin superfamily) n=1 Tax=Variovorax boronicumulans TaxID=436515 RepID=A0AAW8DUI4_9BURK|nr:pirin family protein [Variovorax boronicumulans]MDP9877621.1 redox-sensitive bicupin YhaK (pirin superfamily) [Variovorax boronicumulans]MDP9922906.1 redox-sensitive bicupin YhaK (pirin superfamily) [Variovorax boronicumulans]
MEHAVSESPPALSVQTRRIVARTRGRAHGPVTRVVSPSDIGELIKPFVFLDYFDFKPTGNALFPMHPHSGIATITVLLSGDLRYEDTTGASGTLSAGSVEWMRAGNGVWHDASPSGLERFQGYQVWVALPRRLENRMAHSQYLPAEAVPQAGPARIVLGRHDGAHSRVAAPEGMNLLHVRLAAGERWRYQPPAGHDVAWTHVHRGELRVAGDRLQGELAVFEESNTAIDFTAEGDTDFIVGSAVKHPHDLVLGYYSVHTSPEALQRGEAEIARLGRQLRADGRIR